MCKLVDDAMSQMVGTSSAVEWVAQVVGECVAKPPEIDADARNVTMKVLAAVLNTYSEEAEPISGTSSAAVVGSLSDLLDSPMDDGNQLVAEAAKARGIVDGVLASMVSGLSPGEPASEVRFMVAKSQHHRPTFIEMCFIESTCICRTHRWFLPCHTRQ